MIIRLPLTGGIAIVSAVWVRGAHRILRTVRIGNAALQPAVAAAEARKTGEPGFTIAVRGAGRADPAAVSWHADFLQLKY